MSLGLEIELISSFELEGNKYAVVEIETNNPEPGFYQVLKYKVLKCAKVGIDINSPDVKAFLVACEIPREFRKLCEKYGIRWVEKKIMSGQHRLIQLLSSLSDTTLSHACYS